MEAAVAALCVCVFILGVLVDRLCAMFYRKFVDDVDDAVYEDDECIVI